MICHSDILTVEVAQEGRLVKSAVYSGLRSLSRGSVIDLAWSR